jgi:chemotaxis protein MotA
MSDVRRAPVDLGTILGIVLGFGLVIVSILVGGGLPFFLDGVAFLVTAGGTFAACLIAYPFGVTSALPGMIGKAFASRTTAPSEIIARLVRYAELARRDGMIAIDERLDKEHDPTLKRALRLAVDGTDPKILNMILRLEVRALEERHVSGQNLLMSAAGYAPAFGMLGTLVGLIQMLLYLEDPTRIGRGMALALVTTFWGVFLSNLVFHPLAVKLRNRTREEKTLLRLVAEGVTSIQEGDSPRIVKERLHSYLAADARNDPRADASK